MKGEPINHKLLQAWYCTVEEDVYARPDARPVRDIVRHAAAAQSHAHTAYDVLCHWDLHALFMHKNPLLQDALTESSALAQATSLENELSTRN